jgi:pimeloyl-ACP methyl ester carboxylesterase
MKLLKALTYCFLCLVPLHAAAFQPAVDPDFTCDSIRSALDGTMQPFYYRASTAGDGQPLVVVLHQWSHDYRVTENNLREQAKAKNWNYVFPNFRGANNHPKACCSAYVVSDIDQAIDWAIGHLRPDPEKIYVVGASGGGYAALCAFMQSRHRVRTFAAWVPITDLTAWYRESLARGTKYAGDILRCTGSEGGPLDEAEAKKRSPLYAQTPTTKLNDTRLLLFAGIDDGHTGSVPVTHSLLFYNKLLRDLGVQGAQSYVSRRDISALLRRKPPSPPLPLGRLGSRDVLYRQEHGPVSLTVFSGGHEMLPEAALEVLH